MSLFVFSRRSSTFTVAALVLLMVALTGCGIFGGNESNPPDPPSNVTLSASQNGVEVTWSASSEATGYNIYRSTSTIPEDLSNASTVNGGPLEGATTFQDGNAENTTVYYYRVTAVNDDGESDPSPESQVRMPFPESPDRPDS